MNDRDLMGIRADTLFTADARGRMLRSNEPDGAAAPRCFLGRTLDGHVIRFGQALPDDLAQRLTAIIERQPPVDDLPIPMPLRDAMRRALARHAPVTERNGGPAYRFPRSMTPPGGAVSVTGANIAVVRETFPWLYRELDEWGPCFAVVRDGAAVSVCFSSRIGVAAMEAGVETLAEFRGRGHAGAVTAAWGASVMASGRVPLYSTGWENRASQAVARRLGLIRFGTDATWT